jgi:hypothetical protein
MNGEIGKYIVHFNMVSFPRLAIIRLAIIVLAIIGSLWPRTGYGQFKPDDPALYETIVRLDSAFFAAYNTCDVHLREYADFYADTLEFFHDKNGVRNSKAAVVESTRKNVCGKVTRELVPGSLEVYPIANYGAVEIGFHKFYNNTDSSRTPSRAGRFVFIWQRTGTVWKITRVISLH